MSRRHIAKFAGANYPPQSPAEARKKAKAEAAESTLSAGWIALLAALSELFQFIGDLTSDEVVAEQCATTIVALMSAPTGGSSLRERYDMTNMINVAMKRIIQLNLDSTPATVAAAAAGGGSNQEAKSNIQWTALPKTRELLTAQTNAAFTVLEETLIEAATIDPHGGDDRAMWVYVTILAFLQNSSLMCVVQEAEGGWSFFDTFSERFFTSAIVVTAERFPLVLETVMNNVFNGGAENTPFGEYLRRETSTVSAACLTLLIDWLWKSISQVAFTQCQAESIGGEVTEAQLYHGGRIKKALRLLTFSTMDPQDSYNSPLVSRLIARAQQTLAATLNNLSTPSLPLSSLDVNVSIRTSIEFFDSIYGARNIEMQRLVRVMVDAEEIAITLPLIIQVINSPSLSTQNRETAVYWLQTICFVALGRDELVRLGYLKLILDTIVPYLLCTKEDDLNGARILGAAFYNLIRNDHDKESFIRLADFPREYIEIDSPQNLIRAFFDMIQSEVAKSKSQSQMAQLTSIPITAVINHIGAITCLMTWYDSLVRAQVEESRTFVYIQNDGQHEEDETTAARKKACDEHDARLKANIIAGKSEYMVRSLQREMYDYFIQLASYRITLAAVSGLSSLATFAATGVMQNQNRETLDSFKVRTGAAFICSRLLTEPITEKEFIQARMTQPSATMIDDLLQQSCATLTISDHQTTPIEFYNTIVRCRVSLHTSLHRLARYTFKPRPPSYVESLISLLLRLLAEDYGVAEITTLNTMMQLTQQHVIDIQFLIDQERCAALTWCEEMINSWSNEDLSGIPFRVLDVIRANHGSYLVKAQLKAMKVVGLLLIRTDLFSLGDWREMKLERGVDLVIPNDMSEFIMSARQFFFDIILYTPSRQLAQFAFEKLGFLIRCYGRAAFTRGEVKLLKSTEGVPPLNAYMRVSRLFLSSRLPCQSNYMRRACWNQQISFLSDQNLADESTKMINFEISTNSSEGASTGMMDDESDDPCQDSADEQPIENTRLMHAFFDATRCFAWDFSSSHFLASIFSPIIPALKRFHHRTWNHEIETCTFIGDLHFQLGAEMSPYTGTMIIILASFFMSLKTKDSAHMTPHISASVHALKTMARDILATKPDLDLTKVLPEEVRLHFVQTIEIAQPLLEAPAQLTDTCLALPVHTH